MNLTQFYAPENRTSGFMDPNYGGPHWGQDLNSASRLPEGTEIPALSSGRVVRNRWHDAHGWYISHEADEPGWFWTHSHRQSRGGPAEGQMVAKNGDLGPLGNTGWSTAPHDHVQYTKFPDPWLHTTDGTIDPWPKIQASLASWAGGGGTEIDPEEDEDEMIATIANNYTKSSQGIATHALIFPDGTARRLGPSDDVSALITAHVRVYGLKRTDGGQHSKIWEQYGGQLNDNEWRRFWSVYPGKMVGFASAQQGY